MFHFDMDHFAIFHDNVQYIDRQMTSSTRPTLKQNHPKHLLIASFHMRFIKYKLQQLRQRFSSQRNSKVERFWHYYLCAYCAILVKWAEHIYLHKMLICINSVYANVNLSFNKNYLFTNIPSKQFQLAQYLSKQTFTKELLPRIITYFLV